MHCSLSLDAAAWRGSVRLFAVLPLIVHLKCERTCHGRGGRQAASPRLTGRSAGDRNGRPPRSAASQQAARARTFAAAGQAWARRTPIVAVSRARPAIARLVTVSVATLARSRKVTRNVRR